MHLSKLLNLLNKFQVSSKERGNTTWYSVNISSKRNLSWAVNGSFEGVDCVYSSVEGGGQPSALSTLKSIKELIENTAADEPENDKNILPAEEEILNSPVTLADLKKAVNSAISAQQSMKNASARRSSLLAGSSRKRVTTANAKWAAQSEEYNKTFFNLKNLIAQANSQGINFHG